MRRHIGRAARRSPYYRLVYAGMYAVLTLGALSVLFPLGLMLAQSVSSRYDMHDARLVPRYLYDDTELFRKYLATKYHARTTIPLNRHYDASYASYRDVERPDAVNAAFVRKWTAFRDRLPLPCRAAGFTLAGKRNLPAPLVRPFQRYVEEKYDGDIATVNRLYASGYETFDDIHPPVEDEAILPRCIRPEPRYDDFAAFKAHLPGHRLYVINAASGWHGLLRDRFDNAAALNEQCGTSYPSLDAVPLFERAPQAQPLRDAWGYYVRRQCPHMYVDVDRTELGRWRALQRELNGTDGADAEYPGKRHMCGFGFADWQEFLVRTDVSRLSLRAPSVLFRNALLEEYGTIEHVNRALGTAFASPDDILPPYLQADWYEFGERKGLRTYFLTRNFAWVWRRITVAPTLLVTVVYVAGVVLAQALVNVLCGYALSRFRLPYTYTVLTLLLVTMAFPAEVTLLPTYLMLKQWNLLNTFWALVLPAAFNGYFIFILKGFFDSIPRNLYEAGQLDGLSEIAILHRIALPLARPVLAWLVLQSFMLAYGSFLYAMIVCQDEGMRTLMVWIYELFNQQNATVIAAASVMAAVPGVVIFLFAQRLLMRGVVIPMNQ